MKRKRILVIGPVYPFKGGISHYTGLLSKALSRRYRVRVISYSMQYPKLLFRKEQRDYANDSFRVPGAEYLLNTANPFNIIRTARIVNRWRPDLVIIQWWHPYFAPCYRILTGLIRGKVLFVCHNVFPHERFPLDRFLTKMTLRKGDFFILHSEKEVKELKTILRDPACRVNMHPTYSAFRMAGEGLPEAGNCGKMAGTGPDGEQDVLNLLFFGFVRPYKGLKYLLMAAAALKDMKLRVVVAGDFDGSAPEYLEMVERLQIGDRVEIHDEYTPDGEVQKYFDACDAVVLPYIDATQSGIAQIAFGFGKPVIATRVGGLPEVVTDGVTGVLCESGSAEALSEAVRRFCLLRETVNFEENIANEAERFSWDHMVKTIDELAFGGPSPQESGSRSTKS